MPAAMVAVRAVPVVTAVVAGAVVVVAVEGVAAKGAHAAADQSSGQRVAVKGGGKSGTGHGTDGGRSEHAMFTRAAGRGAEAEQAEGRRERGG